MELPFRSNALPPIHVSRMLCQPGAESIIVSAIQSFNVQTVMSNRFREVLYPNPLPSSLPIESPLILQPPSIPTHTPDSLAIKVRHGIVRPRPLRIDPVSLDPLEEPSLFNLKLRETFAVEEAPEGVAEDGTQEPADGHGGEDGDARRDDGVGGNELYQTVGGVGVFGEEVHCTQGGGEEAEDGGGQGIAAARGAECEESIPIQRRG